QRAHAQSGHRAHGDLRPRGARGRLCGGRTRGLLLRRSTPEDPPADGVAGQSGRDPMSPLTASLTPAFSTMIAAWEHRVGESADEPILHSFADTLTFGQVDAQARALAAALVRHGVTAGD